MQRHNNLTRVGAEPRPLDSFLKIEEKTSFHSCRRFLKMRTSKPDGLLIGSSVCLLSRVLYSVKGKFKQQCVLLFFELSTFLFFFFQSSFSTFITKFQKKTNARTFVKKWNRQTISLRDAMGRTRLIKKRGGLYEGGWGIRVKKTYTMFFALGA